MRHTEPRLSRHPLTVSIVLLAALSVAGAVHSQTTYNVGCTVAELKTAIDDANVDGTDSVLELSAGCDYLLTTLDNADDGNQGLPTVDVDGTFRINGNGATIRRDAGLACDTNDGSDDPSEFAMFAAASGASVTLHELVARDFCSTDSGGVLVGISDLDLTVTSSSFENNRADGSGGVFKAFTLAVSVSDSAFIGNRCDDDGGAIFASTLTLDVARTDFIGNSCGFRGGALRGSTDSILTIQDSTFRNNAADTYMGGAIYSAGSTVNVVGSTFENNTAGDEGGAIRMDATTSLSATLNILNSTFVGNRANTNNDGAGAGGAIWFEDEGAGNIVNINHSTFRDNTDDNLRTFFLPTSWTSTLKNSIVDNGANPICDNAFDDGQDNLLSDASCDPSARGGSFNRGAPTGLAATPTFNSGLTHTVALLPGSNAIDAATQCTAVSDGVNPLWGDGDTVTTDQRALARPFDEPDALGAGCDIGAFEWIDTDADDLDDGIEDCCWIFGDGFEDGTADAWQ